jgi:ABC-2 type transport system permease protein
VALVAGREITERTRSRTFAVSTLAVVAVVVAAVVLPGLGDPTTRIEVGVTGTAPTALPAALREGARADGARLALRRYPSVEAGEAALRDDRVGVLIVGGRRLVWKAEPDPRVQAVVTSAVRSLAVAERAAELGLSPAQAGTMLTAPVPVRHLVPPDPDRDAREIAAMVGALGLLTVLLWYGMAVAEGVAQEKGGRVMEVLLSRVEPRELLAGKVIGIGLVGLAQILLALAAASVAILAFDTLDVPSAVPATLASAVLWFVLGYAFWSVAFAALGALVSRPEDLQAAAGPLTWTLTIAAVGSMFATESPDAWYMRLASLVPITAPFVMPVRIAVSDVPAVEIALAVVVMIAATAALVRLAGAVYAGALLRTGVRPRARDLWEAARAGAR